MIPAFFKDKQGQWQVTPLHLFKQGEDGRWYTHLMPDPKVGRLLEGQACLEEDLTALWQAGLLKVGHGPGQSWVFYIKTPPTERNLK